MWHWKPLQSLIKAISAVQRPRSPAAAAGIASRQRTRYTGGVGCSAVLDRYGSGSRHWSAQVINQVTAKMDAMNSPWPKPLGMGPDQKKCLAVVMTQNNKTNHAKLRRNRLTRRPSLSALTIGSTHFVSIKST